MMGIDDVRERVQQGRDAHGWPAVLEMIANEMSADADDNQAAGQVESAKRLDQMANLIRQAAGVG